MSFEKGHKQSNGRPKGSKNKSTVLGRDILQKYFFEDNGLKNLLNDIDQMEYERDKVNAKIKLLEYIMPKQKEIDIKGEISGTQSIMPIHWVQDLQPNDTDK